MIGRPTFSSTGTQIVLFLGHFISVYCKTKGYEQTFESILDSDLDAKDLGDDELDDEELEAQAELDKDHEVSDDAEIQDLAKEVERDAQFFIGAADSALGRSALLKVCFMKCLTWLCQLKSQSAIRRS